MKYLSARPDGPVEPAATPPVAEPLPLPSPAAVAKPVIPLTPDEQARLAELPAGAREQVLAWLSMNDPILAKEARRRLAPVMAKAATPATLGELLERIREDPSFVPLAADGLCRALGDPGSYRGFLARCQEAWQGAREPERLVDALRQATGPKAKNRGAVFMHAIQRE